MIIRRILSHFRRRQPRPVVPLSDDNQAAQILLHVAEDSVAILEASASKEAADLAAAAVDTLEGVAVERLFAMERAPAPSAVVDFFAVLASGPADPVSELIEQHRRATPEYAALIRHVGPGVAAKLAARQVRETEQRAEREAVRLFRAAIAGQLVDSELDEVSALVLSEAVPRLRERIEAVS